MTRQDKAINRQDKTRQEIARREKQGKARQDYTINAQEGHEQEKHKDQDQDQAYDFLIP